MSHVILSFLGRSPRGEDGYRATRYHLQSGEVSEPTAFLGWPLARQEHPRRMVILGTEGSMWDHLFEGDLDFRGQAEEQRLALVEAVEDRRVGQALLNELAPLLGEALEIEIQLLLIPYCRTLKDQTELLRIMAGTVSVGDRVDLDVTHGFRHLPMLALLAALHLRRVRKAQIRHIYYGAYDMAHDGITPVIDLGGLLEIADWLEALSAYEHSGDYDVFSDLVGDEETGRLLAEASFLEGVQRIGQARSRLRQALKRLDELPPEPAWQLFRGELRRRIAWAQNDNYYLRQRRLCHEYLERGRYRDAILTGWEAFTTLLQREAGGPLDPDNHEQREQVRKSFDERERAITPRSDRYHAFDDLRRLRNAVAHGSQPKGDTVQRALGSAAVMQALLSRLFHRLLPKEA